VLLIDFDQQGNASRCFDIETRESPVFLNLFRNEVKVTDTIIAINEFLHIIPSNLNNSRLDFEMSQKTSLNMKEIIKNIISPIRNNYDLIIMDCPPAINRVNATVTCASDLVVIPINPDQYALDGMQFSISEIEAIKVDFGLDKLDFKLVWNKYDAREKLGTIYMHALVKDEHMIDKILPVVIRTDTDFKNSVHEKRSIFEISKKSSAKEDIDELTREILGIRDWLKLNMKGKSYAAT
jgi:chromosome partitioning protein